MKRGFPFRFPFFAFLNFLYQVSSDLCIVNFLYSALPLNKTIQSGEHYVWPSGKGNLRGQSIIPLYPSVTDAVQKDSKLYELLALIDALRVGKAREKELAILELKKRIVDGEYYQTSDVNEVLPLFTRNN